MKQPFGAHRLKLSSNLVYIAADFFSEAIDTFWSMPFNQRRFFFQKPYLASR